MRRAAGATSRAPSPRRPGWRALVYSRRGYGAVRSGAAAPAAHVHARRGARACCRSCSRAPGSSDAILVGHSRRRVDRAHLRRRDRARGCAGSCARAARVRRGGLRARHRGAARRVRRPGPTLREKLGRHHAERRRRVPRLDGRVARSGASGAWNLEAFLPGVRAPVLVIQGEDDEYGTLAQVDAVCAGVAGPVERLILRQCGHVPQRDRNEQTLAGGGDVCQENRGVRHTARDGRERISLTPRVA